MIGKWWPAGVSVFGSSQAVAYRCEVGVVCRHKAKALYLLTPVCAHSSVPPRVSCFDCAFTLVKRNGECWDCGKKFKPALEGFRVQGVR